MNRSIPFGSWARNAWWLVPLACSSQSTLPPEMPNCQGGKGTECSVQPGAGGAGSAGGTGEEDSGTTTTTTSTTGACGNAGSVLGATSSQCEPCIETGAFSTNGASCCMAASLCGSACQSIITCTTVMCTEGNATGACVSNCVSTSPSGATAFNDFELCLADNCSSCPSQMPSVASEQ